ncbi:Bgt-2231 [Blumeria graminis f. sp. tritici]|uniref:Bgt-2231 n=2 Tax=Blumeria graminis f. sp. tritici TaxID=62690 RepID=A0A381LIR1_BLUGR|nr:G-U mismatch-specific DNA glycosylase [Blumeria graminis f. sp. tritici 96224]VDB84097.1 Bgt-2231 [Blumeria graminis f. sp. tritici]
MVLIRSVHESARQTGESEEEKDSLSSFAGRLDLSSYAFSTHSSTPVPHIVDRATTNIVQTSGSIASYIRTNSRLPTSKVTKRTRSTVSRYAPPEKYSHLPELRDVVAPNLICLFVGLNPGLQTSISGHAYAHPSNLFWKLLYSSGCTSRRCYPNEDADLPELFNLGNTNIVARPTRNSSELKRKELDAGYSGLVTKIIKFRPESVCIVGKSIWESIWRCRHGKSISKIEFKYGWQDETERLGGVNDDNTSWSGARVFVACSTSGLAASLKPEEKESIWRELGIWVEERRRQRA